MLHGESIPREIWLRYVDEVGHPIFAVSTLREVPPELSRILSNLRLHLSPNITHLYTSLSSSAN